MKWFRSNIRRGSRLALLALATQFLLAFGHFHGGSAQAADASMRLHHAGHFAPSHAYLFDRTPPANAYGLQTSSEHTPAGDPTDDCAICAVMALANAMVVGTPPDLLGPQAAAFSYLTTDTEIVALNSARVAFQPRAPPVT
jgi:hypothetical protein